MIRSFERGFSSEAHELSASAPLANIVYDTFLLCGDMKYKSMQSLAVIKKHLAVMNHTSRYTTAASGVSVTII